MRTVFSTLDLQQQFIVRLALGDAGIKFAESNEHTAAMSSVGLPAAPFIFQVADGDFDAATEAIRKALDRIRETSSKRDRS